MGITALWLTPLFEQVNAFVDNAAIHGYWTRDFKRLNPRYIGKGEDPSLNNTQKEKIRRSIAWLKSCINAA